METRTEILTGSSGIIRAASILRAGGLVAFPTETVYGLGANALDPGAVTRIFEAKGRPSDNPLIVHLFSFEGVELLTGPLPADLGTRLEALAARFWPGPLTLVLPRAAAVPDRVTAGLDTVAIRVPNHSVALELLRQAGRPVAAPSANLSGRPSPTRAEHVIEDLSGRVEAILDGGPTGIGLESTVLDLTAPVPTILRPGGVSRGDLALLLGEVAVGYSRSGRPDQSPVRSPGMKYLHYAPEAPLFLFEGPPDTIKARILDEATGAAGSGQKVGLLVPEEWEAEFTSVPGATVLSAGRSDDLAALAANLYDRLRKFDQVGVDLVLAAGIEDQGLGAAIADRLRRAAGGRLRNLW